MSSLLNECKSPKVVPDDKAVESIVFFVLPLNNSVVAGYYYIKKLYNFTICVVKFRDFAQSYNTTSYS